MKNHPVPRPGKNPNPFLLILLSLFAVFRSSQLPAHTIRPSDDFFRTTGSIVSVSRHEVPYLLAGTGLTLLVFFNDHAIINKVQEYQSRDTSDFLKYPKYFGNGLYLAGFGGLNVLSGLVFQSKEWTALGIYLLEGVAVSGIYVSVVKAVFGRERPYVKHDPYHFRPFSFKESSFSFYSGHTTEVFTAASVVAHYFRNPYISIFVYSLASLTGLERIYNNKHWASDVLVGGITGVLIGRKIITLNKDYPQLRLDKEDLKISFYIRSF
ncbi:MAG: phosphatase PAP2 family protein [bacterium]|nr:phosphatase PAP2 family protein [bacterium]